RKPPTPATRGGDGLAAAPVAATPVAVGVAAARPEEQPRGVAPSPASLPVVARLEFRTKRSPPRQAAGAAVVGRRDSAPAAAGAGAGAGAGGTATAAAATAAAATAAASTAAAATPATPAAACTAGTATPAASTATAAAAGRMRPAVVAGVVVAAAPAPSPGQERKHANLAKASSAVTAASTSAAISTAMMAAETKEVAPSSGGAMEALGHQGTSDVGKRGAVASTASEEAVGPAGIAEALSPPVLEEAVTTKEKEKDGVAVLTGREGSKDVSVGGASLPLPRHSLGFVRERPISVIDRRRSSIFLLSSTPLSSSSSSDARVEGGVGEGESPAWGVSTEVRGAPEPVVGDRGGSLVLGARSNRGSGVVGGGGAPSLGLPPPPPDDRSPPSPLSVGGVESAQRSGTADVACGGDGRDSGDRRDSGDGRDSGRSPRCREKEEEEEEEERLSQTSAPA
ncbi:unnamed protein product, partial [Laminaria digitata]